MSETTDTRNWYFSPGVLKDDTITEDLRALAACLMERSIDHAAGVVVSKASEILERDGQDLPPWALDRETRYLIIMDVRVPAIMRLPSVLRLHKPDRRMHVTCDPTSIRRLIVAQARSEPVEGIIDAYVLGSVLVVLLGDFSFRDFPIEDLSVLEGVDKVTDFRLDVDGSFIEWPQRDLHVDASGLLKEVDPEYQARLEIDRLLSDRTGEVLARMRERAGLKQADVKGLSTRHVRRIEKGVSSLSLPAARSFAAALGLELNEFLDELARKVSSRQAEAVEDAPEKASAVA